MEIQRKGYYENGSYFIGDVDSIPSKRTRITVIFHDVIDKRQQKINAIKRLLAEASSAEDELSDTDWDEMIKLRAQTNNGLSRSVDV